MDSSRNTVQFLNEIDWIRECQLRNPCKKLINQVLNLYGQCLLKKNTCISISYSIVTIQYVYCQEIA